ncbi:glycosyl hydrolase 115 family protein [Caulobacter rhizosphaerae]|uniref:glycosyl hydrolase 115 family protein n=1 Tax=Caulobacter rhizosphaerae TaxID=2010972 RepID=UPI0019A2C4CC|nr:glycosyl hydrolase 115 family protein [Caulobacter rhizosphaerae]GGL19513.1 hypothetical protein GCM10010983_15990 [Caulobacter rhizosphaerae]
MLGSITRIVTLLIASLWASAALAAPPSPWILDRPAAGAFPLLAPDVVADLVVSPDDAPVVGLAAQGFADDLAAVSGQTAKVRADGGAPNRAQVWIGTLGRNPAIDRLVADRRLDVRHLKGAWESFVIAVVERPAPGVPRALVIVGSDRRGTAYGVYELSQAIGVSPWRWWADVAPPRRDRLYVAAGTRRFGPPSVKYRGVFLNDEDWGLQPWAAHTFEPETGNIGPKTYAKVFDLLLRLKANTLWPAMHPTTAPFNGDPANARLADRYAIVMGSSHAEPMLRNNVGEWKAPAADYDYARNRGGVLGYWRERVQANGGYENLYTLGMRGIHDSGMVGADSLEGRKALLEKIFADQRRLLTERGLEGAPQVFTPYKEVLDVYRGGLKVPDDVTLVWPDDNFGYIRQFPDATERKRAGGSGVYYHLSYLGAPLSYIWLSTTPPALIQQQMDQAYDLGARRLWVANVGDLKPAEINTELFLALAWDVDGFRKAGWRGFLADWAAREFGAEAGPEVADLMARWHGLNFERKPEHLQWQLPGQKPRMSDLSLEAAAARLAAFDALSARVDAVAARLNPDQQDAFFELVAYPVKAAAAANHRFFDAEAHDRLADAAPLEARRRGALARRADAELAALTERYNAEIAGGKWRGLMAVEPADGQWKSFRLTPPVLPAASLVGAGPEPAAPPPSAKTDPAAPIVIQAESVAAGAGWTRVDGLGRGQGAMQSGAAASSLAYAVTLPPGDWSLSVDLIPTFPLTAGGALRLAVAVDGGAPVEIAVRREPGDAVWAQGVLDGRLGAASGLSLAGGPHRVVLTAREPGVLVDALAFKPR